MDSEMPDRDPAHSGQESSVEAWQAKVDRLQEIVCMLLVKNQAMRMAFLIDGRKDGENGSV
jgi:hypothetical protein